MPRKDSTYHGLNMRGVGCACAGSGANPVSRIEAATAAGTAKAARWMPTYPVSHGGKARPCKPTLWEWAVNEIEFKGRKENGPQMNADKQKAPGSYLRSSAFICVHLRPKMFLPDTSRVS
jgi:hypothetical protein